MTASLSIQSLPDGRRALIATGNRAEVVNVQNEWRLPRPYPCIGRDERLRELISELLGYLYIPERNCSCHLSPPCKDCVEWGGLREMVAAVRSAMEAQ